MRTAVRVHDGMPLVGACYHLAFFLHVFLKREHRIETTPVVGWVNDGTDDLYIPHAWVEHERRKIDVSLARTPDPDIAAPGALLVLDRELVPGAATYSYHATRPRSGNIGFARALDENPELAMGSEELHANMGHVATSMSAMRRYLDEAPADVSYAKLRAVAFIK